MPATHRDSLHIRPGKTVQSGPAVKYRGIFLNDEAPDLTNWIRAKYGNVPVGADPPMPPNIANYGREFYTKLFFNSFKQAAASFILQNCSRSEPADCTPPPRILLLIKNEGTCNPREFCN